MEISPDLSDLTFLILVRLDNIERLENILATTQFLSSGLKTTIWVSEYSIFNNGLLQKLLGKNIRYTFQEDHDPILYRTKFLSKMSSDVQTPFVSIWDADVIVPVSQIINSANLLRSGEADFVYPYETYFMDTSPILRRLYLEEGKMEVLEGNIKKMKTMYAPYPVGGAFLANRQSYIDSGLENENFYGWGLEDGERYYRWMSQGYKVRRVKGALFHLSHGRGMNSGFINSEQRFIKQKEIISLRRQKGIDRLQSMDEQN